LPRDFFGLAGQVLFTFESAGSLPSETVHCRIPVPRGPLSLPQDEKVERFNSYNARVRLFKVSWGSTPHSCEGKIFQIPASSSSSDSSIIIIIIIIRFQQIADTTQLSSHCACDEAADPGTLCKRQEDLALGMETGRGHVRMENSSQGGAELA